MDEIAAISRILCCLELPDEEVYPALARLRDVRQGGNSDEIAKAFKHLQSVFFIAVRQGLKLEPSSHVWLILRDRPELRRERELLTILDYLIEGTIPIQRRFGLGPPPDDEGGEGVAARRLPPGPKPTLRNRLSPPDGLI